MDGRTPFRSRWFIAACVMGALWAGARPAEAQPPCSVSVSTTVAFGAYNVFSASPLDTTGVFQYRCFGSARPTLRITISRGGSTTYLPRHMHSGTEQLNYNLYRTAARTTIWGDETEGTVAYYVVWGGGPGVNVTVYGRVPAGQDVAVGNYADTVRIDVNY